MLDFQTAEVRIPLSVRSASIPLPPLQMHSFSSLFHFQFDVHSAMHRHPYNVSSLTADMGRECRGFGMHT